VHKLVITNLQKKPEFLGTVANRIWEAWSKSEGLALEQVIERGEEIIRSSTEFTLVAHIDEAFVGTISLIKSDLDERPELTPWLAGLWVDTAYRKHRVGSRLLAAAEHQAFLANFDRLYLCCVRQLRAFYHSAGWLEVEENVGKGGVSVFRKSKSILRQPMSCLS